MNLRLSRDDDWPENGVESNVCEVIHLRPEQYLAEVVMIHRDSRVAKIPSFWCLDEYKTTYGGFLLQIKKRLDYCEFKCLHRVILDNKLASFQGNVDDLIAEEIINGDCI